jgi:uncharacterized protein YceK
MFKQILTFMIIWILISGCTAVRYQHQTVYDYKPTSSVNVKKAKEYNVSFDEAWKAAVAVFATNNFQIKTMDKESGIIAAEAFYNSSDMIDMVYPGKTIVIKYETKEQMAPNGFVGSANPNYVRLHGTVTNSETYEISRTEFESKYPVTAFLNLFLEVSDRGVRINVNTKFQTNKRIGGKVPSPVSNGTLEKEIFSFLDSRLL